MDFKSSNLRAHTAFMRKFCKLLLHIITPGLGMRSLFTGRSTNAMFAIFRRPVALNTPQKTPLPL